MPEPIFTDEEKSEAIDLADETMKKAVDSLMALIHQVQPTTSGNPDMRGLVETTVDAILDAAIARNNQYNVEATFEYNVEANNVEATFDDIE